MTHVDRERIGRRDAKWLIATSLVGRLPNGMAPLAIAIFLREQGFSYGLIGAYLGLFAIAAAVGGPLLVGLADRRGQSIVLVGAAVVSAAAFTTLALADGDEPWWAALDIVIAGLLALPPRPAVRPAAAGVGYVVGPLLVIAAAAAVSPTGSALAVAAMTILGALAAVAAARREPAQTA
ncbi:ABC transporter, permease protein [Alloactinosynnema sp. L-07]|uniref:hypothetical protein n=1 Tax=Alloactinosynnema sp. L-07 TaxID=1653480 RepID=UPI00065F0607|nr:hypothetical protein [Alloactinosynnema sp. L-07]CRK58446.1 ABC transporter, permease protein [Alloactinosynnema sp. L-07]